MGGGVKLPRRCQQAVPEQTTAQLCWSGMKSRNSRVLHPWTPVGPCDLGQSRGVVMSQVIIMVSNTSTVTTIAAKSLNACD